MVRHRLARRRRAWLGPGRGRPGVTSPTSGRPPLTSASCVSRHVSQKNEHLTNAPSRHDRYPTLAARPRPSHPTARDASRLARPPQLGHTP